MMGSKVCRYEACIARSASSRYRGDAWSRWFRDILCAGDGLYTSSLPQVVYGHPFSPGIVPHNLIDSRSVPAWVFCHLSDRQGFAAERVGQQVLQGVYLVPLAFLCRLDDTRLQPTHIFSLTVFHSIECQFVERWRQHQQKIPPSFASPPSSVLQVFSSIHTVGKSARFRAG